MIDRVFTGLVDAGSGPGAGDTRGGQNPGDAGNTQGGHGSWLPFTGGEITGVLAAAVLMLLTAGGVLLVGHGRQSREGSFTEA